MLRKICSCLIVHAYLAHEEDLHHPTMQKFLKNKQWEMGQFKAPECQVGEKCESIPSAPFDEDDLQMKHWTDEEETTEYWYEDAQAELRNAEKVFNNISTKKAKYSIIFLGDGMGIPSITGGRIFEGQRREKMINAEAHKTSLDLIADDGHVGLSKTYCLDRQTTDSAASATAYMTGVKSMYQTIGLNGGARLNDCSTQIPENYVESVLKKAKKKGLGTGIITTTRVHHASPSGGFAHIANRNWYSDADMMDYGAMPSETCKDLSVQVLENLIDSKNIDVMMGGGYKYFITQNETTPFGTPGKRLDSRNLIREYQDADSQNTFIHTQEELANFTPNKDKTKLFALFSDSDMAYKLDTAEDPDNTQPSLAMMTQKAIDTLLEVSDEGFYLFVEGGRIDHSHHDGSAQKALGEFIDFDEAIEVARTHPKLKLDETLIVITADHSHAYTLGGYGWRGYNVLGATGSDIWGSDYGALDHMPFTVSGYIQGAGYRYDPQYWKETEAIPEGKTRADISQKAPEEMILDKNYHQQTSAPMGSATHGGEDVAIVSRGPWSHLFKGIHQQSYIAHVMMKAQCLGDYSEDPHCVESSSMTLKFSIFSVFIMLLFSN